jgi:hypothetical protein
LFLLRIEPPKYVLGRSSLPQEPKQLGYNYFIYN